MPPLRRVLRAGSPVVMKAGVGGGRGVRVVCRAVAMAVARRLMSRTEERDVEPRRREMSRASRERRSAVVSGRDSSAVRRWEAAAVEGVKVGRTEERSDMAFGGRAGGQLLNGRMGVWMS